MYCRRASRSCLDRNLFDVMGLLRGNALAGEPAVVGDEFKGDEANIVVESVTLKC